MKFKFKIFIYLSFFGFILSSCSTVQKAFDPERKNSSEEFLVEKKSPLSMPPDYNELPMPKSKSNDEKETVTSLESLIIKDNNNSNQNNQETEIDKNLEKSILDEIIKN